MRIDRTLIPISAGLNRLLSIVKLSRRDTTFDPAFAEGDRLAEDSLIGCFGLSSGRATARIAALTLYKAARFRRLAIDVCRQAKMSCRRRSWLHPSKSRLMSLSNG